MNFVSLLLFCLVAFSCGTNGGEVTKECTDLTKVFLCKISGPQETLTFYKFRTDTGKCESFTSPCMAYENEKNVFTSESYCKQLCEKPVEETKECTDLTKMFMCKINGPQETLTFYKFRTDTGKCESFTSPCKAYENEKNVFTRESDCKKLCEKPVEETKECTDLKKMFMCKINGPQVEHQFYKFRTDTGKCEGFTSICSYGNLKNVFSSEAECKTLCEKEPATTNVVYPVEETVEESSESNSDSSDKEEDEEDGSCSEDESESSSCDCEEEEESCSDDSTKSESSTSGDSQSTTDESNGSTGAEAAGK